MRSVLAALRVFGVAIIIIVFLSHMSLGWLVIRDRFRRMRWCNRILSYYARVALWNLDMHVRVVGRENLESAKSGLFVGNHLSYTDILAISSELGACYVTSTEIRAAPVLGQICLMAGCLFVERRNKMNIRNEVSELRRGLNLGLNVVIFPEATSTNGESVLRFRRPLFFSAIDGGCAVIPMCINYLSIDGEPITVANRDLVCWYGDMGFVPHLWNLALRGRIEVELTFLKPIPTTLDMDPTGLAEQAHAAVASAYHPIGASSRDALRN